MTGSLPGLHKALQDAKQYVRVETPLMSLIQDNHRVGVKLRVVQHLSEEGAVCVCTMSDRWYQEWREQHWRVWRRSFARAGEDCPVWAQHTHGMGEMRGMLMVRSPVR